MLPPFDIFRVNDRGDLIWFSAANTIEEAKALIQKLCEAEFVILNQETQEHITIKPEVKVQLKRVGA